MRLTVGNFLNWSDLSRFSGLYETKTLQDAINLMEMREEAEEIANSDPTIFEDLKALQQHHGELEFYLEDMREKAKELNDQIKENFPQLKKTVEQTYNKEDSERINGILNELESFVAKL